jgi:CheY-like chemotaxis protein
MATAAATADGNGFGIFVELGMSPRPRRVLVVDDNPDAAVSLTLVIRELGHVAEWAMDGIAAIDVARRLRPEIVFLDLALPGIDGYEVAERLKREPGLDGVRIIAMTGSGSEQDRRRTLEGGFELHIVKPVDPRFLDSLLAR